MHARLLGLGTALPAHELDQAESARLAGTLGSWPEEQAGKLAAIYRRSTIQKRASVLLEKTGDDAASQNFFHSPTADEPQGPATAARFARFETDAPHLAARAASAALKDADVPAGAITHLIVVSCTGVSAPGVDADLVPRLGLRPDVERAMLGFMGCAGAISGVGMARSIAEADGNARVLVVSVELCSLHLQYSAEPEQVIANAIFADGAAAAVVGTGEIGPRVVSRACRLIPDSADAMSWRVGNHGLRMSLSPRVPEIIGTSVRPMLSEWLAKHDLRIDDVGSWAIHPGGPRVIESVAAALGLNGAATEPSRAVLREHGNMSSATVLFVHDRLRRGGMKLPCVWLGFSPGLTAEAVLLV